MATHCYHCSLPVVTADSFSADVAGGKRLFCCAGCQAVYLAIYRAGLQDFYQKTQTDKLAPPPAVSPEFISYDLDEVQSDYVTTHHTRRTIHLLVDGIHCAACIWLIEHALKNKKGVIAAEANLTARRCRVTWDNNIIALSSILSTLAEVGYVATPFNPQEAELNIAHDHRSLLYRMAFAAFAMMNLLWVSIALYSGADQGKFRDWFYWISFIIATPTLFYAGYPFLRQALLGLRRGYLTMDLPIAIGAVTTYSYSTYVVVAATAHGAVYFDTVVNFLFVILVGRYLEAISRRQALSATTRLLALQPRMATLFNDGQSKSVPIRSVNIGDLLLVKPGERIPVDGIVVDGQSAVDESMITGESMPVSKKQQDTVIAGSMNGEGAFIVKAEHILRHTMLAGIVALIDDAQSSKAPIQQLADKIVPWFVAMTLLLACVTFIYWYTVDTQQALLAAVSVLIITCPCALGLATPMSVAVATGVGASHGILIKQGSTLEKLSRVTHFVFDKTGTLTEGQLRVTHVKTLPSLSPDTLLSAAASIEQQSDHSIAKAIVQSAVDKGLSIAPATDFLSSAGQGVRALVEGKQVLLGTERWLSQQGLMIPVELVADIERFEGDGYSSILVAIDKQVVGIIALSDTLRSDAKKTIHHICKQGYHVSILSGDKLKVVVALTATLGDIDRQAELLPKDKLSAISALQQQGAVVAMVGDGINDSPSLMQADVGIALASGSDVSIDSADIILSHRALYRVVSAVRLAGQTLRIIRQNICLSITYNVIMVPLAMMLLVTPLVAALTMPISSLLVIANAARLKRFFKE